MNIVWILVIVLICAEIIREYVFLIWLPTTWNIQYPWKNDVWTCDPNSKNAFSVNPEFHDESDLVKCLNDWKSWLTFEVYKYSDLVFDFTALFFMVLYRIYFYKVYE